MITISHTIYDKATNRVRIGMVVPATPDLTLDELQSLIELLQGIHEHASQPAGPVVQPLISVADLGPEPEDNDEGYNRRIWMAWCAKVGILRYGAIRDSTEIVALGEMFYTLALWTGYEAAIEFVKHAFPRNHPGRLHCEQWRSEDMGPRRHLPISTLDLPLRHAVAEVSDEANWSPAELIDNLVIVVDAYNNGPITNEGVVAILANLAATEKAV